MTPGYEVLEHTSEVGIRSWGDTVSQAFEQAGWGLADVLGAVADGRGEPRRLRATAADREALLVDFLNELNFLHESEEVAFAGIRVIRAGDMVLEAEVHVVPLTGEPTGVGVKAATYHDLRVVDTPEGIEMQVYLDV